MNSDKDKMIQKDWIRGLIIFILTTLICSILAIYTVIQVPVISEETGVSALYVVAAIYVVFALWFGLWGVLAAFVSCVILGIVINFPLLGTIVWSFADLIEAIIPLVAFRELKGNEELKTKRDWLLYLIFGILLPSLFSAIWGSVFHPVAPLTFALFSGWFIGDLIVLTIIATPMLYFLSPMIKKTKLYVKGYLK